MALAIGSKTFRPYSHPCSPKTFTQPQLFACLVLKEAMKLDYRGTSALLADSLCLREAIHLKETPHFTTLQKASVRLLRRKRVQHLLDNTLARARKAKVLKNRVALAAIDSSGFEAQHASRYFVKRRERGGDFREKRHRITYRHFPKLAVLCDCRSHLILAAHPERGPKPDFGNLDPVFTQAASRIRIQTLLGDAGYDAEWVHIFVRFIFGTRTIIPAEHGRKSASPPVGYHRRLMRFRLNKKKYGQRWQAETVFSMIKRRLGEATGARTYHSQCRALLLKVITHNILIVTIVIRVFYRAGRNRFLTAKFEATGEACEVVAVYEPGADGEPVSDPRLVLGDGQPLQRVARGRYQTRKGLIVVADDPAAP
jgi:DDE family transposase